MKDIVVDFGPVRAVDRVSIALEAGEIVGLLGENGAGKSTLMNVLAGDLAPQSGKILIDGREVSLHNARQAAARGIRFIHQELNLCNDLKVFENMFLAEELSRGPLLDKKQMIERARGVFERMRVDIDPRMLVNDLSASQKQLVEIARSLLFDCRLIIMDEPTTALTTHEIENLFDIMRKLREQGVSFIYISHKMPELFQICRRYYVLRDGVLVGEGAFSDVTESGVTELMIGRQLAREDEREKPCYIGEGLALKVEGFGGEGFEDITLDLREGEILAITGLQSSGRDALADALYGALEARGNLTMGGRPLKYGGIKGRLRRGMAMVPRNRKERGILTDLSILDNLSMGYFNTKMRFLLIGRERERERFSRQQAALSIRADRPQNPITSLSGGNQQKVILGRWLETDAGILLFDNPTQGIDVGTKFEIYHLILNLAQSGKAILIFSSEFSEIHRLADSCIVLYQGRINAVLGRGEITEKNIMYYSTGANLEERKHG